MAQYCAGTEYIEVAMKAIRAKPILGGKRLNIQALLKKYADLTIIEMEKTTETWENTDPEFIFEIEGNKVKIGPTDDKDGDIWRFLNDGTDVRYAVMSEDFEPKTSPGIIGSTAGVGGLTHFDFDNPKPGIEARNWTELIGEKLQPKFAADVQEMLKQTLNTMS